MSILLRNVSILLRIVGGIWAIFGVASIVRSIFLSSPEPYGGSIVFAYLLRLMPYFLLYIIPGLVVLWIGAAIAKKKEIQETEKQSNKNLEIGIIIGKSLLLAVSIFFFIFGLSFFVGGNLGPIVGVIYGSIASLAFFIYFIIAWILRARGFAKMRAYSIAFVVICLIPVVYSAVAFTFHLIR